MFGPLTRVWSLSQDLTNIVVKSVQEIDHVLQACINPSCNTSKDPPPFSPYTPMVFLQSPTTHTNY